MHRTYLGLNLFSLVANIAILHNRDRKSTRVSVRKKKKSKRKRAWEWSLGKVYDLRKLNNNAAASDPDVPNVCVLGNRDALRGERI